MAARTRHVPEANYADHLAGRDVTVVGASEGRPRTQLDGTWWRLRAAAGADPPRDGDRLRIVTRDGLDLVVGPHDGGTDPADGPPPNPTSRSAPNR
jgi:membrane protein implicated in regulation of membrane protease activity